MCGTCDLAPCACNYIAALMAGGEHEELVHLAQRMSWAPRPHRGGCPCPGCFSERLSSWAGVVSS